MSTAAGAGGAGYEIGRAGHRCAATGRALAPGEAVVAVLVEDTEAERMTRLDFDAEAWDSGARPGSGVPVYGFWRTRVPEPNAKRGHVIDAEGLVDLFEQLEESDIEERRTLRYLIALVLIRRRELVYEGVDRSENRPALLVRYKGEAGREGDPMRVPEPVLDEVGLRATLEAFGRAVKLDTDDL